MEFVFGMFTGMILLVIIFVSCCYIFSGKAVEEHVCSCGDDNCRGNY